MRLSADGFVELIAGDKGGDDGFTGDGGPALQAKLNKPIGLAFDAKGDLFIADAANMCIRRIRAAGTPEATIEHFAGAGLIGTLVKLKDGVVPDEEGAEAKDALIIGPTVMTFDQAGNMYVSEAGSNRLSALGGSMGFDASTLARIGPRIRKITPEGKIFSVAGEGTHLLNNPGTDDSLITSLGMLIDREGRLIIADAGNNQIKLLPKGSF